MPLDGGKLRCIYHTILLVQYRRSERHRVCAITTLHRSAPANPVMPGPPLLLNIEFINIVSDSADFGNAARPAKEKCADINLGIETLLVCMGAVNVSKHLTSKILI